MMGGVVYVKLSDKAVREKLSHPNVTTIRDSGSRLRLRVNKARTGGSWYLVDFYQGQAKWHKLGNYPEVSVKAIIAELPKIEQKLAGDRHALVVVNHWTTVGDLLGWYEARVLSDANLTAERKATIKSNLNCHLLPKLKEVRLGSLERALIDEQLIWPLQEKYTLSHVRSIFAVLKTAFKQAQLLRKIAHNPMAGLSFTDFISAELKPKEGRLRSMHFDAFVRQVKDCSIPTRVMILLMLCFGTRIGETRKARWRDFDLDHGYWFIPAQHTKTRAEHRLPLSVFSIQFLMDYRIWQKKTQASQYLFPGVNSERCVTARTASDWIGVVSGREWSAHDLRKLARTRWTDQGVDYMVGELLLNHALSKLDKTYIHTYAEAQMRAAIDQYHEWLIGQNIKVLTETIVRPVIKLKIQQVSAGAD